MGRFLLITMVITGMLKGHAQNKPFPKLENLYKTGKYDRCIENAADDIKSNQGELYPYVWQMRSYIAIDDMVSHPLKKGALVKALNIAAKINKKDKGNTFYEELIPDFATIEYRWLNRLDNFPENQYNTAITQFLKIIEISQTPYATSFRKYEYMYEHNDAGAFQTLLDLISKHYKAFKNGETDEPLEEAYARLMELYFDIGQVRMARDILIHYRELKPDATGCADVYKNYIKSRINLIELYPNETTLSMLEKEIISADSLLHDPLFSAYFLSIKKQKAIALLSRISTDKNENVPKIKQYLTEVYPYAADTLNSFMCDYMVKNLPLKKGDRKNYYNAWIALRTSFISKQPVFAHIKNIHSFLLNKKFLDDDFDFLLYCRLTYPALKTQLAPLSVEYDKALLNSVSEELYRDQPEQLNKAIAISLGKNNKELRTMQYNSYVTKLTALLEEKNYSGFAVNIAKALAQFPADPKLLLLKKQYIIADYKANFRYAPNSDNRFTTTPDIEKCEPGVISPKGHAMALQCLNYYRRLASVPDSCVFDESLNKACQKAALMMEANGSLDHHPPKTWKCYTDAGAGAAGTSNLSLGASFAYAIEGQIDDDGSGNYACGHRRWLLNPNNTVFGHGSTNSASAISVFGSSNNTLRRKLYYNDTVPVCWPAADYFPKNLVTERWSLSLSRGIFDDATVVVKENGKVIPVTIEPLKQGYGLNTIVWVVQGPVKENTTYTVTVSNIKIYPSQWSNTGTPVTRSFTYKVIPIVIE